MNTMRNLHVDPHCHQTRGLWHGQYELVGERYRYRLADDGATRGSCFAWEPITSVQLTGMILYARLTDADEIVLNNLGVEGAPTIIRQDNWIVARCHDVVSNHALALGNGSFILDEVAVYEPACWERIYDLYQHGVLARPFFAGETVGGPKGDRISPGRACHNDKEAT